MARTTDQDAPMDTTRYSTSPEDAAARLAGYVPPEDREDVIRMLGDTANWRDIVNELVHALSAMPGDGADSATDRIET